jgi:thymidylate synthase (FAD)
MTVQKIDVLDHGYVKLLNVAGPQRRSNQRFDASDTDPANSARMSFNQRDSGRTYEQEMKLTRYLWNNEHGSPFEMIQTWWEVKLPIFLARQFVRHRTQSLNEVSARYTKLPNEWYTPKPEHVTTKSASNKQGRTNQEHPLSQKFASRLKEHCQKSYAEYEHWLSEGIPPEVARNFLHVNHYTVWLSSMNLRNLSHFLRLRADHHAQWEAQQYASAMLALLRDALPDLMEIVVPRVDK